MFDIYYLPYKYEDRRKVSSICRLEANSFATIVGTVKSIEPVKRFRLEMLKSVISDDTGDVKAIWFNNLAIKRTLHEGQRIILTGPVKTCYSGAGVEFINPSFNICKTKRDDTIHAYRIVPFYSEKNSDNALMRESAYKMISEGFDIEDNLHISIRSKHNLPSLKESLINLHFPNKDMDIDQLNNGISIYHRRLAFNELFNMMQNKGIGKIRTILDDIPKDTGTIETRVITEKDKALIHKSIDEEIRNGGQVYIINALNDTEDLEVSYDAIRRSYPHLRIEMIHRHMDNKDKKAVIEGKNDILVSTLDAINNTRVPKAGLLVVVVAGKIDLMKLHKIRRALAGNMCIFQTYRINCNLLRILEKTDNGFEIAEEFLRQQIQQKNLSKKKYGISLFTNMCILKEPNLVALVNLFKL